MWSVTNAWHAFVKLIMTKKRWRQTDRLNKQKGFYMLHSCQTEITLWDLWSCIHSSDKSQWFKKVWKFIFDRWPCKSRGEYNFFDCKAPVYYLICIVRMRHKKCSFWVLESIKIWGGHHSYCPFTQVVAETYKTKEMKSMNTT